MNTSRLAMAIAALGLAFSGPLAWAHGQGAATGEAAKQAQADQPSTAASDTANAPQQGTSEEPTRRNAPKHPPTARMDSATPLEKAPSSDADSMHPPTGRMDRATPAEKSPGSDSERAPARSPDNDKAPAEQPTQPDKARPMSSTTT